MSAENLWRVDIVNPASDETGDNEKQAIWHSINSQVFILTYYLDGHHQISFLFV